MSTEGTKGKKMWLLKTLRMKAQVTLRRANLSSFTSLASPGSR